MCGTFLENSFLGKSIYLDLPVGVPSLNPFWDGEGRHPLATEPFKAPRLWRCWYKCVLLPCKSTMDPMGFGFVWGSLTTCSRTVRILFPSSLNRQIRTKMVGEEKSYQLRFGGLFLHVFECFLREHFDQLMVNMWFGLVVWIPRIPLWKPRIPNHQPKPPIITNLPLVDSMWFFFRSYDTRISFHRYLWDSLKNPSLTYPNTVIMFLRISREIHPLLLATKM